MAKRAILVGCNYPGTEAELYGCVNDVFRMKELLLSRFGFDEQDIVIMIDTDENYPQPTGANIRKGLSKIVDNTESGDILFMHYSGHGSRIPPESGEPDDTGYDECIVPTDMNVLSDNDFRDIVNKLPDGVSFTFVTDCCHSGGLIDHTEEQIGDSVQDGNDDNGGEGDGNATREFHLPVQRNREYSNPQEYGGDDSRRENYGRGREDHGFRCDEDERIAGGRRGRRDNDEGDGREEYGGRLSHRDDDGRDGREDFGGRHGRRDGDERDGREEYGGRHGGRHGRRDDDERDGREEYGGRHGRRDDDKRDGREEYSGRHGRHDDDERDGREEYGGRHGRRDDDERDGREEYGGGQVEHGYRHGRNDEEEHVGRTEGRVGQYGAGAARKKIPMKNRAIGVDMLMGLLKMKYGGSASSGGVRTLIYSVFGKDASPMVQIFAGILIAQAPAILASMGVEGGSATAIMSALGGQEEKKQSQGGLGAMFSALTGKKEEEEKPEPQGGLAGMFSAFGGGKKEEERPVQQQASSAGAGGGMAALAMNFLKTQMNSGSGGQANSFEDVLSQATPMAQEAAQKGEHKQAFAGWKPSEEYRVRADMGILVSGCQSDETSADANPDGNPKTAYGALTNCINEVLAKHQGPITNRELVLQVRKKLKATGFTQNPGLYCSDTNLNRYFICD